MPHTTRDVARQCGVPYQRLFYLLQSGQLEPPQKDSTGRYVWLASDVERARKAIQQKAPAA